MILGYACSHHQAPAVKCSVKANDGYLYPMDRCFIFIHKPPTYIRYSDVTVVEFARVSSEKQGDIQGGSRTFDLVVYTKGGNDVQFTGMQRYLDGHVCLPDVQLALGSVDVFFSVSPARLHNPRSSSCTSEPNSRRW